MLSIESIEHLLTLSIDRIDELETDREWHDHDDDQYHDNCAACNEHRVLMRVKVELSKMLAESEHG